MSSWEFIKLDEHIKSANIELGRGDIISKDDINNLPGAYPIYSSSAHNNGKFGEYAKFMFDEELITWSVDGGGHFFYRPKHKFSVTNVCGFMRIKSDRLDTPFVYYSLSHQHKRLTFDYTTKAHPSVIKNLYWLPKIDVSVQKRISTILITLDQAIEKTEALIEKYQQIKAGLMHDLFTRGIGADGKLRPPRDEAPELYQETQIGWIPKGWKIDAFGKRVEVIDPNPSHRYPIEVGDGYPICSTENFDEDDSFDLSKSKKVSESTFLSQNNRCGFKLTDVIFARKGKIGLARRYGLEKKVFSHTVVIMKPTDHLVDAEWLLWISRANWFLGGIEAKMNTNSGVPTLGVEFIKSIIVPFPDESEQRKITPVLETVSKRIKVESETLKKMIELKSGLMHDLLTGEIQVHTNTAEEAHV